MCPTLITPCYISTKCWSTFGRLLPTFCKFAHILYFIIHYSSIRLVSEAHGGGLPPIYDLQPIPYNSNNNLLILGFRREPYFQAWFPLLAGKCVARRDLLQRAVGLRCVRWLSPTGSFRAYIFLDPFGGSFSAVSKPNFASKY